jgi:hypothetical protein
MHLPSLYCGVLGCDSTPCLQLEKCRKGGVWKQDMAVKAVFKNIHCLSETSRNYSGYSIQLFASYLAPAL